jgi:hypothetical protein
MALPGHYDIDIFTIDECLNVATRRRAIPIFLGYFKDHLNWEPYMKAASADTSNGRIDTTSRLAGVCDTGSTVPLHETWDGPLFIKTDRKQFATQFTAEFITQKEETMLEKTFNALVEKNKEAAQIAGKLAVGKTANNFLLEKLLGTMPWYTRLFGKSQFRDNPIAKLATAQLAVALSLHFAKGNDKVAYVADAMLQDAAVDLLTNSKILEDVVAQLSSFAGDLTNETK